MDQQLLNDIVSTGVGGAAGGAVAGLVIMAIQGMRNACLDRCHANRIYSWLKENTDEKKPFRSTRAIASHNNVTEDRVRYICSIDPRIKLSTGKEEDMWSIHVRNRTYSTVSGIKEEL